MQTHLPDDPLELALARELQRGENVLWHGRPVRRVQRSGFALWLFAIPWTVFSVSWTAMAFAGTRSMSSDEWSLLSLAFPLFGVPFICIGLAMLASPFRPLFNANRIIFAVTDQRLIKLTLGKALESSTVPANRIGVIQRLERRDGSGLLMIATHVGLDSDGDRATKTFDLGEVEDVMDVADTIKEMQERHKGRTPISKN